MALRNPQTPRSYDEIVRTHALSPFEHSLRERIREALAADPALDLAEVTVDVDGHEVVLTGSVPGPATATRIEDIAKEFQGVERVDNQLAVRSSRR